MNIERNVFEPGREVLSIDQLDHLLYLALKSLKDKPVAERSIVTAGVYDPLTGYFYLGHARNTNVEAGYGKWNHAEYEAIQLASKNGVDLPQSIIVTSLGPCLVDSTSRAHKSCTETIIERGIKKAHIGILDNRQADQNLYVSLGLQTTLARNETLIGICNLLNDYFNPSKEARLQGLDKAAYIDEILKNLP